MPHQPTLSPSLSLKKSPLKEHSQSPASSTARARAIASVFHSKHSSDDIKESKPCSQQNSHPHQADHPPSPLSSPTPTTNTKNQHSLEQEKSPNNYVPRSPSYNNNSTRDLGHDSDEFASIPRKRTPSRSPSPYRPNSRRRQSFSTSPLRYRSQSPLPSYRSRSRSPKEVCERMVVPDNLAGLIIGRSYEGLRSMNTVSGAKVLVVKGYSKPGCAFDVVGQPDQVRHCCNLINARLDRSKIDGIGSNKTQRAVDMWVPIDKIGLIVGVNGATIKIINERSGAHASVQNERQRGDSKPIKINGTPKSIDRAKAMISDVLNGMSLGLEIQKYHDKDPVHNDENDDGRYFREDDRRSYHHRSREHEDNNEFPSDRFKDSGLQMQSKVLYIPQSIIGIISGKKGSTLKMLQKQSGASIKIESDEEAKSSNERMVMISGSSYVINKAQQMIDDIIRKNSVMENDKGNSNRGQQKNDGGEEDKFVLSAEYIRMLIGKNGSIIREIEARSGAIIEISGKSQHERGGSTRNVAIFGTKTQLQIARLLMAEKLSVTDLSDVIHQTSTRAANSKATSSIANQAREACESKEQEREFDSKEKVSIPENLSEKDEGECSEVYPPPETATNPESNGREQQLKFEFQNYPQIEQACYNDATDSTKKQWQVSSQEVNVNNLTTLHYHSQQYPGLDSNKSKFHAIRVDKNSKENRPSQNSSSKKNVQEKTATSTGANGNCQPQGQTEGIPYHMVNQQQIIPYPQYPQPAPYPHYYAPPHMYGDPSMNYHAYAHMQPAGQSTYPGQPIMHGHPQQSNQIPNMGHFPPPGYMNSGYPPHGGYLPPSHFPSQMVHPDNPARSTAADSSETGIQSTNVEAKKSFGTVPHIQCNPHGQVWSGSGIKTHIKLDGCNPNVNTLGKLGDRVTTSSEYQSNGAENKTIGQIEDHKGVQGPNVPNAPFYEYPGYYPNSGQGMVYGHHPSIPYGGYVPYQHPSGCYGGSAQPFHHQMNANATTIIKSGSSSAVEGPSKVQNEGGQDQTSPITPTKEVS